jgi:hypothetical protein
VDERKVHIKGLIAGYRAGKHVEVEAPTGLMRVQVVQTTHAKQDEWNSLLVARSPGLGQ